MVLGLNEYKHTNFFSGLARIPVTFLFSRVSIFWAFCFIQEFYNKTEEKKRENYYMHTVLNKR